MWINNELYRLRNEKNYGFAYELFVNLINRKSPDISLLKKLYGNEKAQILQDNIKEYFEKEKSKNLIPRQHVYNTPIDILNARSEIEKNKNYQKIQSSILKNEIPPKPVLKIFYGEYTDYVYKILETYKMMNLMRKCELTASTHISRVAAAAYQLKMNDNGSFKYSTIALMHDSVEDLLDYGKLRKNNKIHFDYYNSFMDEYIPKELQQSVKILTNHYHFFINFIVDKLNNDDKSICLKNILIVLEKLLKAKLGELNEHVEKMYKLLTNVKLEDDIINSAKWECYKNLYLNGIAQSSAQYNDYRVFEIKGLDLSDNAHGKGSLSSEAKMRNMNKNILWGIIGYNLKSSWKPLNDKIEEIIEDALQSAEALILSDLLQVQSSQDFIMSALHKIKKLEPVFYT